MKWKVTIFFIQTGQEIINDFARYNNLNIYDGGELRIDTKRG